MTSSHIARFVVVLVVLVGATLKISKSLRLSCFVSDRDEIWQYCTSSIYTSIDF